MLLESQPAKRAERLVNGEMALRHQLEVETWGYSMRLIKNNWIAWGLIVAVVSAGVFYGGAGTSFARSSGYCDSYARDFADRHSNTGGDVLGGAVGGAMTGALLGGIFGGGGGAAKGAGIGAGVGAFSGGASSANAWAGDYNYAYDRCMSGRR